MTDRTPLSAQGDVRRLASDLIERHQTLVYRRALRMCHGNRALAEEAFQESFVRLFAWLRSHPEAVPLEAFPRLLSTFATRAAIDLMRRERPHAASVPDVEALAVPAEDESWAWAARADVATLLGMLDERSRKVIELTYFEGLSATEVGQRMRLSAENVRVLRHRALRAMRRAADKGDVL